MAEDRLTVPVDVYGPEAFARDTDVSRETLAKFAVYESLLKARQPTKNLVGPATLDHVWQRHFWDSAQLAPLLPERDASIADLGSGAGFPGMVLALLGYSRVTLFESNGRKCAFLREVAGATDTAVTIRQARVEDRPRPVADITVARACAPLVRLLGYAAPLLRRHGRAVFHKGARAEDELTQARKAWTMRCERHPSRSDPAGVLLEIKGLRRVR